MSASLAGLPVALGLLLTGFQATPDDWASWGDARSAIEYSSLLSGWSIDPKNNRMTFETKLPLISVYVPTSPRKFVLKAELWKDNGAKELHAWDLIATPNATSYPFLKVAPNARTEKPFAFTQAGDYTLKFWVRDPIVAQGLYITELDFQVELLNDPQKAKPVAVLSGPWDEWAYLWFPFGKRENGHPEVRFWRRADLATKPEGDQYLVKIVKNGLLLGQSEPQTVTDFEHTRLSFPLKLPENLGGSDVLAKDLLAQVGGYHVLVEKNGKPEGAYLFEVEHRPRLIGTQYSNDPAFKFHPNQRPIESVHEDFIVPRMPGDAVERDGAGDTLWMERMSNVEAALVYRQLVPAANLPNPMTPMVNPAIVTPMVPIVPAVETPREVANLTVNDPEKLHTIPLPSESTPKPESQVPTPEEPARALAEPSEKPIEATKTAPPTKRPSRTLLNEEPEFAWEPPSKQPPIWESHLGLIASIFAAHIALGVFCSYKILKAA